MAIRGSHYPKLILTVRNQLSLSFILRGTILALLPKSSSVLLSSAPVCLIKNSLHCSPFKFLKFANKLRVNLN
jgi:hypothetical protein